MNKYLIILVLLTLFGNGINAQTNNEISPSDFDTPTENTDAQILELVAIFNDAIDAPTDYNEYVKPFINEASFPVKQNYTKQEYDVQLKKWIIANPLIIEKFLIIKQEAHIKLYGPRKN